MNLLDKPSSHLHVFLNLSDKQRPQVVCQIVEAVYNPSVSFIPYSISFYLETWSDLPYLTHLGLQIA